MFGMSVMLSMTLSGHPLIINKIADNLALICLPNIFSIYYLRNFSSQDTGETLLNRFWSTNI